MTAPDTITRDELAEALRNVGSIADLSRGLHDLFEPGTDDLAAALIRYVIEHREPEYEPGEIYQDADGSLYERIPGGKDLPWRRVPMGDTYAYRCEDRTPKRPLRKLIAQPAREQVEAALTEDGTDLWRETLLRTYVDRIMRLLEGKS